MILGVETVVEQLQDIQEWLAAIAVILFLGSFR